MNTEWRLLRADEIEIRTGQLTKDGSKQSLLLYKDARCDMDRLDEFGQYNWQREHKDVHGVSYCGVSLWDKEKGCWVTKWDAGKKSKTEPEKGEASDSFKRACVNWGIGRELYTAPQIWVSANIDPRRLSVSQIAYNDKREIITLVIVDDKGTAIFQKGVSAPAAPKMPSNSVAPQPQEKPAERPQLANKPLTPREQDELDDALAKMDFAQNRAELLEIFKMYKDANFAHILQEHGAKICSQKGWRVA